MLSQQAMTALGDLEAGAKLNCIHTVARELIAAGMAFDGWGQLEITEMGRRAARGRRFHVRDDQVADLWNTPANSHEIPDPDFELLPMAPGGPDDEDDASILPDLKVRTVAEKTENSDLVASAPPVERSPDVPVNKTLVFVHPWSRERAVKAAGMANGIVDCWVDERWICAFMDAYEQI